MDRSLQLERLLDRVEKPGRYIGGELNTVVKPEAEVRFGFAFPDTYEIGMSFAGMQILYSLINKREGLACERVFAPAPDMEALLRENGSPLFTLETKRPVRDLDLLGFTLQYELSYTNILNMLDLADIPLYREERGVDDPFVVGGGPCAFNPEPLADFFDFFLIGDGEESLLSVLEAYRAWKRADSDRNIFLSTIRSIPGVYVPGDYRLVYATDGTMARIEPLSAAVAPVVRKAAVASVEEAPYPEAPIVPIVEVVHDRSVIETFRGCTRGCRFCQAGMIYRPVRERSKETILRLAEEQRKSTGYDELSLLSLSTSDHSCFEPLALDLVEWGTERNVSLSLPSLRLDSFSFQVLQEIQKYKKTGLTFAPEAGTQRLRDVINKNISDEDIRGSVLQAASLGWTGIKLYFMIGLPTETMEDVEGIASTVQDLIWRVRKEVGPPHAGRLQITASVSNFVPKAHTPFQWAAQDDPDTFTEKHHLLKDRFRRIKGAHLQYHGSEASAVEAVLARGDRSLSKAIETAWRKGAKFDSWREHFRYPIWMEAFADTGIDPRFYSSGMVTTGQCLPWQHIDCGVSEDFLRAEWERALAGVTTGDCRLGCVACGVNAWMDCPMEGTL